jgi:hypothetical protein
MTDSPDPLMSFRSDLQQLTRDLGCMSGTLKEIATVWRRAHQCRPDLPLGLPLRLENATHQLAGTVDDLTWAVPRQRSQLAFLMKEQISALERDAAAAEAMTCSAGILPVGDTGLWGNFGTVMHKVRVRALSLDLQLPKVTDWPGAATPVLSRSPG